VRAITKLLRQGRRAPLSIPEDRLREFLTLFQAIIVYKPGDNLPEALRELKADKFFASARDLQEDLERNFFKDLYVDRPEREVLEVDLLSQRTILMHGLPGCGKTILCLAARNSLATRGADLFYLDIGSSLKVSRKASLETFSRRIRTHIFDELYDAYITQPGTGFTRWELFALIHDPSLRTCKRRIGRGFREGVPTSSVHDQYADPEWNAYWQRATASDCGRRALAEANDEPLLETLLRFLRTERLVGLCFDNVDELPIRQQEYIVNEALSLTQETSVSVIVTIRDANLQKLNHESAGSRFVVTEEIGLKAPTTPARATRVHGLSERDLRSLLERRMGKVEKHVRPEALRAYFDAKQTKYPSYPAFVNQFWRFLGCFHDTFLPDAIYEMANHDIRQMLILYYSFVSRVLLSPDADSGLSVVMAPPLSQRVTQLRTFFLRWVLLGSDGEVPAQLALPNILDSYEEKGRNLAVYYILAYMLNYSRATGHTRIKLSALQDGVARLGITPEKLGLCIEQLGQPNRMSKHGLIWRDEQLPDTPVEEAWIAILPAGSYFVREVATSLEAAFWTAAFADIRMPLVASNFSIASTYRDRFKIDAAMRLMNGLLLPGTANEIAWVARELQPERGYGARRCDYFVDHFCVDRKLFARRLWHSLEEMVSKSDLTRDERAAYRKALRELDETLLSIEQKNGVARD
jgi:hypothetical protein